MNLIIIGPSGGGKGTQAEGIAQRFNLKHISMGEVFRNEIERGTDYGNRVKEYMEKGEWVPTDLVLEGLSLILGSLNYRGFILDGFPRLPDQPKALDDLLDKGKEDVDLVIHLEVSDQAIMARRKKAWQEGHSFYNDQRNDETLKAIKGRLRSYHENIAPILDYYRKKGILVDIDGERSVEEIFRDTVKLIKKRVLI